jgi:predicted HAD superfamily phosphohydrolase YqeG
MTSRLGGNRLRFTLKAYRRHREALRRCVDEGVDCVLQLPLARWAAEGVKGCVLDFDGVLAHHGVNTPLPVVQEWLRQFQRYPSMRCVILSNHPTLERAQYFQQALPESLFLQSW